MTGQPLTANDRLVPDFADDILRLQDALTRIGRLARDQHEDAEVLLDEILTITERELAT